MSNEMPIQQDQSTGQQTVIMVSPPASPAPVKAGQTTLGLTWLALLLPLPGVSIVLACLFSFVTVIISIICMAKNNISAGVWLLIGNLFGGLLFYGLGLLVMFFIGANSL